VKYTGHEFVDDAQAQYDRLPDRLRAEVLRTLGLLQVNPYLVGTELVGRTSGREIRRVAAAQGVSMDFRFPISLRPNSKVPLILAVLSLDLADL